MQPKITPSDWIPVTEHMPEDLLPISKPYKIKTCPQVHRCTPYVLVIRKMRERPDCAMRVEIDGRWVWMDGDGITVVTHWLPFERPPYDRKAVEDFQKAWREAVKHGSILSRKQAGLE